MAETTLKNTRMTLPHGLAVLGMESGAIGTSAESLATAGFTIPTGTTMIVIQPAAAMRTHPAAGASPTTSFGHLIPAEGLYALPHHQLDNEFITTGGGDTTAEVLYLG